jgi:hypothetical protein
MSVLRLFKRMSVRTIYDHIKEEESWRTRTNKEVRIYYEGQAL